MLDDKVSKGVSTHIVCTCDPYIFGKVYVLYTQHNNKFLIYFKILEQ